LRRLPWVFGGAKSRIVLISKRQRESWAQSGDTNVTGYLTTATTITVAKTLLEKPGGYLTNDLFAPGIWLDNMPSWEMGALTMLRDTTRVYRNDFSRSQSQSAENPNLAEAEGKFFFDNNSWFLPDTEGEYKAGIVYFQNYLGQLSDQSANDAQFYARSDNLQAWLAGNGHTPWQPLPAAVCQRGKTPTRYIPSRRRQRQSEHGNASRTDGANPLA
jgi:hypothetical protein